MTELWYSSVFSVDLEYLQNNPDKCEKSNFAIKLEYFIPGGNQVLAVEIINPNLVAVSVSSKSLMIFQVDYITEK